MNKLDKIFDLWNEVHINHREKENCYVLILSGCKSSNPKHINMYGTFMIESETLEECIEKAHLQLIGLKELESNTISEE